MFNDVDLESRLAFDHWFEKECFELARDQDVDTDFDQIQGSTLI